MEINMHAVCAAVLCLLFVVISLTGIKADKHRSDVGTSSKRQQDITQCDNFESLCGNLTVVKEHTEILNDSVSDVKEKLINVQDNIWNLTETLHKTRRQLNDTVSVEKLIAGFKKELEDMRRELAEERNALEQNFVVPLQVLNETLQHIEKAVPQDLLQQIKQLKAEQEKIRVQEGNAAADFASFENSKAFQDVLQQISQFKENYVSKDELKELKELQRDKRTISNKCSLNVRQKPEGGRFDVHMVMDPPCTEDDEST